MTEDTATPEADPYVPKILTRRVQVMDPTKGFMWLEPGPVPVEYADLLTNPLLFVSDEIEEPEELDVDDVGTGPFENRKKDQLLALAKMFPEVEGVTSSSLKAEIIEALENAGIEPSTIPEEG